MRGAEERNMTEQEKLWRMMRAHAEHQRHIGFAVGYREGRRANEGNALTMYILHP